MNQIDIHQPFFSVIIPTYNRSHELQICLASLVAQTFFNFEVLVCDDGSTDNTKDIVKSFEQKLKINYIWNENWGGPARPRNIGINASFGVWISFLDSDDWWFPNKLQCLYEYIINNPKTDVICHDLIINNKNLGKKKLFQCGPVNSNLYCDLLKYGNKFANSALSIKKVSLQKFNITITESKDAISVEDYDLCLRMAAKNATFNCINIPLGENILESNNISSENKHFTNLESLLKNHVFEIQTFESNKQKLWDEVFARLNIIKGARSFRQKKYLDSIRYYFTAIIKSRSNFMKYVYDLITQSLKSFRTLKFIL